MIFACFALALLLSARSANADWPCDFQYCYSACIAYGTICLDSSCPYDETCYGGTYYYGACGGCGAGYKCTNDCPGNYCVSTAVPTYANLFTNVTSNTAVSTGTPIWFGAYWSVAFTSCYNTLSTGYFWYSINGTSYQSIYFMGGGAASLWYNYTATYPASARGGNYSIYIRATDYYANYNDTLIFYYFNDTTLPTFTSYSANTTAAGAPVNFSVKITDNVALSGYIFSTNNTGTFKNYTWTALASGGTAYNITTLNSTAGTRVNATFYANDSSNNWAVYRSSLTTTDATPPTYSLNSTNSTLAGTAVKHSLKWADNIGLSGYIFSFDNSTGTFVNDSWTSASFSGTSSWSNVTKKINSTTGSSIRWCVYANDTSNNWNGSSCTAPFSYLTTTADTCTYSSSGNWNINCADNCRITSPVNMGGNSISITGTGTFQTTANISNYKRLTTAGTSASALCVVTSKSGGGFLG